MYSSSVAYQDEGYSEDPLTVRSASRSSNNLLPEWLQTLSEHERARVAMAIIKDLPTSMVADIYEQLRPRLCLDFIERLPTEVCLRILSYLDSTALINVALSSRAAQSLAFDWKLWSHLYYLEGWKTVPGEVEAFQQELNSRGSQLMRTRSDGDDDCNSRAGKRRAMIGHMSGSSSSLNKTHDVEMANVDTSVSVTKSLFGDPLVSQTSSMSGASTGISTPSQDMSDPETMDFENAQPSTKSRKDILHANATNLVTTDRNTGRQSLNWRHLYTQRKRLEANWDAGKYVNFQIPHPKHMYEAHSECIYTIQFQGRYLVSGSRDKSLRIWDMETRRLTIPPLIGHTGSVLCLQFDSSPEEDLIVSGSSDASVILWKFSTGQAIKSMKHAHTEPVLNVRFDHRILVTCSKDKLIKIFNRRELRSGEMGYPGQVNKPGSAPVAIVLDNFGHNISPRDDLPLIPPYTRIATLAGHGAAVNAIQIWGNEVVSASGDRQLKLWDWPSQLCMKTFNGHSKGIACVQYDGRRIVSGSSDNEVKVFDRQSGLEVATLKAHSSLVRTVQAGFADLPDSMEADPRLAEEVDKRFFRALRDGSVSVGALPSNRSRNPGSMQPEHIMAVGAKLPPGGGGGLQGRIVSGSYDESVILWRRDKHGAWMPRHTFRQEEAARVAATALETDDTSTTTPSPISKASTSLCVFDPNLKKSDVFYHHFIDMATRAGPLPLRQLLRSYPAIFASPRLRTMINSENDLAVRSQLELVFNEERGSALLAGRIPRSPNVYPVYPTPMVLNQRHTMPLELHEVLPSDINLSNISSSRSQSTPPNQNLGLPSLNMQFHHGVYPPPIPPPLLPVTNSFANTVHTLPVQMPTQPGSPGRVPQEASTTARVFKLQFDARRIVCCSQTNVIVGWDFACHDEQIIEASRFFAGID